eukprot:TRINITY_DN27192_c0_g1_i1.p1 TRINITY_DN27192_c0_g1~~TRINITY_DN27192_c0_g1_i1.p1  ORF type:complete len:153 (-),score=86.57 TRINITY_DN27192_c0_g1_i1:309-767(-)
MKQGLLIVVLVALVGLASAMSAEEYERCCTPRGSLHPAMLQVQDNMRMMRRRVRASGEESGAEESGEESGEESSEETKLGSGSPVPASNNPDPTPVVKLPASDSDSGPEILVKSMVAPCPVCSKKGGVAKFDEDSEDSSEDVAPTKTVKKHK